MCLSCMAIRHGRQTRTDDRPQTLNHKPETASQVRDLDELEEWAYIGDTESTIYKLNTGHEILLDLALLRCPCGTPFQSSPQSAICTMCCNATCSASCHKVRILRAPWVSPNFYCRGILQD